MSTVSDELAVEPVIAPGETPHRVTVEVAEVVLKRRFGLLWWIAFAVSAGMLLLGVGAVFWLFVAGVGIWGIDWPVAWGFAIMNYVWWIAIASGGTLTSAIFYLTGSEWRSAITRIAETMMLCGAACAGIYPILHLGRPYFFYWLFPYPDTMQVWPQFRSPLLWDFFAILAYVLTSIMFWYMSLIPDLATMRDRARSGLAWGIYGVLALGWRGSSRQWRVYKAGYGIVAGLMAPLVVSVHSIVGLDFAGGLAPGWHSTQFPPFFVFGALYSGFATVLAVALVVRAAFHCEDLITTRHLDIMARLMLASSLAIALAYSMELFTPFYSGDEAERTLTIDRLAGEYAPIYWATILCNVLAPQLLWVPALRRHAWFLFALCLADIYGMWCERYIIVVTTLHRDFLPSAWGSFSGTFWDWSTMIGTIGLFLTMLLLAVRVLPSFSMAELRELAARKGAAR
jgi:molybdopterin-containing oxidoreductase family membrane subunit